ncbi:hypothetical protein KC19_1G027600 [Ceratodon purpureus]|uniref:Uncharacterized protein n=1 Tax=Ceratodon purpureus TaxID=3225 RepID=A0A8T0J1X0_CERPU|nr:hypothetical protein KC19_1G027600 [Ceratodon purpureus]
MLQQKHEHSIILSLSLILALKMSMSVHGVSNQIPQEQAGPTVEGELTELCSLLDDMIHLWSLSGARLLACRSSTAKYMIQEMRT